MNNAKPKLYMKKAKTFKVLFRMKDDQDNIINLNGYQAHLQARVTATKNAAIILDLSTDNESLSIDDEAGEISGSIAWDETSSYPDGTYPWELDLISPTDERYEVSTGKLIIETGVIQ